MLLALKIEIFSLYVDLAVALCMVCRLLVNCVLIGGEGLVCVSAQVRSHLSL